MCTEIDSKSKIDPNLAETIGILEKNNIQYWLCHGTLLGIVRDNELIPWDTDIDIGVWYSKNLNEKLKTIMTDHEYKQKPKNLGPGPGGGIKTTIKRHVKGTPFHEK